MIIEIDAKNGTEYKLHNFQPFCNTIVRLSCCQSITIAGRTVKTGESGTAHSTSHTKKMLGWNSCTCKKGKDAESRSYVYKHGVTWEWEYLYMQKNEIRLLLIWHVKINKEWIKANRKISDCEFLEARTGVKPCDAGLVVDIANVTPEDQALEQSRDKWEDTKLQDFCRAKGETRLEREEEAAGCNGWFLSYSHQIPRGGLAAGVEPLSSPAAPSTEPSTPLEMSV